MIMCNLMIESISIILGRLEILREEMEIWPKKSKFNQKNIINKF